MMQNHRSAPSSRELLGQDHRHAIRHYQQRLLLLHHADACQQETDRCTATPYCAAMKTLWDHMKGCNAPTCSVRHCTSSRRVWSHYGKCKDVNCQVCMPVRVVICRDTLKRNAIVEQPRRQGPLVQQNQMAFGYQGSISAATTFSVFVPPDEADSAAFNSADAEEPSPKRFKETKE